jgi:hypothetical protein
MSMLRDSALLSRRVLLAGLGASAVGAATAAAGSPILTLRPAGSRRSDSWWDRTFQSLHSAGLEQWSGLVGETFALASPNGSHKLRIAAVTPFSGQGARPAALGRRQAFSVVFESVAGPDLPAADGVYQLAHRSHPPLPVYMGAPSAVGRKARLVAVFN